MKKRIVAGLLCLMMLLTACGDKMQEVKKEEPLKEENIQGNSPATDGGNAAEEKVLTYSFDTNVRFQTLDGFGAAYTWYSDWLFRCDDVEGAMDALFKDAKLTVLRFKNEYEYDRDNYAWNAQIMQKYYEGAKTRAKEYGEEPTVLMSCWSPPSYLKEGNDRTGGASLKKDENGNYCYEEYADWWVESVQYYESFGFNIDYVCIQNEVDFAADYDGCRFAPQETDTLASYAKAHIAVYDAFKEAFGEEAPKILGPETMSCELGTVMGYMNDIIKERPDAVYGIAHHLYVGGEGDGQENSIYPESFITDCMSLNQFFPDYAKWQTEYYIGRGLQTAQVINNCMIHENANAYLYWSGVWEELDPGFENTYLMGTYYNRSDWVTDTGWRLCADYYALRHFSEFVRPGYTRIKSLSGDRSIASSAYISPDEKTIAIILINPTEEEYNYQIANGKYTFESSRVVQSVFGDVCESADSCCIDLGPLQTFNKLSLPAGSVTSIEIKIGE